MIFQTNINDIELDQYVIMPNHIHGILIINKLTEARLKIII
jgi:REP element-mobilizing transposase RayT